MFGYSSLTFSVRSVISAAGSSCTAFAVRSQASCSSCGSVSPEGVWCIWPLCSGGLPCGRPLFGFLLHAQISSYLHWALAFPGSWLVHWVFAYVLVWTGTLFRVPQSRLWMVRLRARSHIILHLNLLTIDLHFQPWTVQPFEPVPDLLKHKHTSKSHNKT